MFRLSRYLSHSLSPFSSSLPALVFWNITGRCNLGCQHCYISANKHAFSEELTFEEGERLVKDLAGMGVRAIAFTGGEPVMREDLLKLTCLARELGLRVLLSSNGTLVTPKLAKELVSSGVDYIGISLDGLESTHDQLRGKGAFRKALRGLVAAKECGLNVGVRFTITRQNLKELPQLLELMLKNEVKRFVVFHLVYAGRGKGLACSDLSHEERRGMISWLIQRAEELRGKLDLLTADNYADGVFAYQYLASQFPYQRPLLLDQLKSSGCSAGMFIANIDNLGNVHPCQFWQHLSLGNVRKTSFSYIWQNDKLLLMLRSKGNYLRGKCGRCHFKELCGGCRVRAEVIYGDIFASDPSCYLTEAEILSPEAHALKV